MVRKKDKPSHLSSTRHKQVTWNLPDTEENGSDEEDVVDLIDDSEESDDSYEPPPSYYNRSTTKTILPSNEDDEVDDIYKPNCSTYFKNKDKTISPSNKENVKKRRKSKKAGEIDYGLFNNVLQNCEFSVKVEDTKLSESSIHCMFGRISLNIIDFDVDFVVNNTFWVYVSKECDQSAIYFEWYENVSESFDTTDLKKTKANNFTYFRLLGNLDTNIWSGLGIQRCFQLVLDKIVDGVLYIDIYLLKSALVKLNSPSEYHPGPRNKYLPYLCSYFYSIEPYEKEGEKNHKHDIDVLYKFVKNFHCNKPYSSTNPQHHYLIPTLRPYQKRAVQWMLYQEQPKIQEKLKSLHSLYVEITSLDNVFLYYNRFGRYFVSEKPFEVLPFPGGILADEMGLGKTVEVLACVMCHPRPNCSSPLQSDLNGSKEENCLTMGKESFDANEKEPCPVIKEEVFTPFCEEEKGNCLSGRKHPKRRNSRIVNYSLLDSVLDSDNDSNFDLNLGEEEKDSKFEMIEEEQLTRRCKRKAQNIDSDNDSNYDPNLNEEENEDLKYEMIEEGQLTRRCKRKAQNIDSDNDSNYDHDLSEEEKEDSKFEMIEEVQLTRQCKRKAQNIDYSEFIENNHLETEFEPSKKKRRIDIEAEISSNPISKLIDSVILNMCWDGHLTNYKKEGSYKQFREYLKKKKSDPYYMMTIKEKLTLDYENKLAVYCASSSLKYNVYKGFFETKVKQKSYFECVCGKRDNSDKTVNKVQCTKCSLWQHAICVQFKLKYIHRDKYICPHCLILQPPVPSGATLIVSPSSISYQWVEELKKHLRKKSLQVYIYKGVAKQGYIQPLNLASYDIVVTTYETLKREVNYVDLPHSNSEDGRRFRFPKRFMTIPSPLPCIDWWRICLDEAQMVEGTCTKTAEMALRLTAVNRWCITGTPIQKSVNDLQGLLMFLGVDPYYVHHWWKRCLYDPYCYEEKEPLHNVLAKFMWRNSKLDVIKELNIPSQTEELHWLNFTPVEDHFYRRLHSECSDEALKRIKKFPDRTIKLSSLDRKTFSSLVQPLLKLRQACDHPQVVKGHFTGLNRQTLTMEELLDNLLKKTQIEAEDAHRIVVASMNGLAALDIIRGNYVEAVGIYREILRSVEEHKENVKTDSLQQLHTLYNLSEIIQANHEGIHPTLRDETLKEEAKAIRDEHLKIYPQRIAEAKLECEQITVSVEDQKKNYNGKIDWWIIALETLDQEFVQEVREQLLSQYSRYEENKCLLYPIQSKVQLMLLLRGKLKELRNQRTCIISNVRDLLDIDPDDILNEAIDCHLRPFGTKREFCLLCRKHEIFEDYEKNLFFMKEMRKIRSTEKAQETRDNVETLQLFDTTRQGNWGQSEIERVLRYLQTKSLGRVDPKVHEDSQTHLSILQAMKKEFKNYRILWRAVYDRVSALDEVNMATLRYRLQLPGEDLQTVKKKKSELSDELKEKFDAPKHILKEGELDEQGLKLKSDKIVSQSDFRVKLGQYFYLKNLKKVDFGKDGGLNPEPCPVCQVTLGVKWKVLLCGHSFCLDCVSFLIKKPCVKHSLKCPICRQPTRIREIAYVDMRAKEKEEEVKVLGSLSTKIEGVVRVMLKIKSSDPEAKVLIFSTWTDVLEVIADGFRQNGITHRTLQSHNKFQETLSSFKSKQEITALLMSLSSGANGLNLVEARHVMLVEPNLNPAAEFQAIGRVHRIGQDKPTVVHRFIINDTIEERMHKILQPKYLENSSDENSITIEDLYNLFARENGDEDTHTDGNREDNEDLVEQV